MLDEKSIVKLADGISLYNGDGPSTKFYVFNTLTGDYFSVNAFGYHALARVDGSSTIAEIVDDCLRLFSVSRDVFLNDIIELFETGVEKGILAIA